MEHGDSPTEAEVTKALKATLSLPVDMWWEMQSQFEREQIRQLVFRVCRAVDEYREQESE